jgi:hypothetical protein
MKTVSNAQIQANQANSKFSTGPQSPEAKRKVSLNPVKHGYAGIACFIPAHEQEDYEKHFQQFRADYKPKGKTEAFLVQSLAQLSWSVEQIRSTTTSIMSLLGSQHAPFETGDDSMTFNLAQAANVGNHLKEINLLGIYEQRKLRLFNSTRRELAELQKERKLQEKEELTEAAQIRKAAKKAFQPWQPEQDGFACSLEEIDSYIARNERLESLIGGAKMTC